MIYLLITLLCWVQSDHSIATPTHTESPDRNLICPGCGDYFPQETFSDFDEEAGTLRHFARQLSAMGEPPLSKVASGEATAIRITWLGNTRQAVLRFEIKSSGHANWTYKLYSSRHSGARQLLLRKTGNLDQRNVRSLLARVSSTEFQSLPGSDHPLASTDGVYWLVEAKVKSHYKAAYRMGPFRGPVQDLAREAAAQAGITIDDEF